MSNIGIGLRAKLLTHTSVTNLVGTRIYPKRLPKGAQMPAVVYHKIAANSEQNLQTAAGLCHTTVQYDCHADTDEAADALKEVIRLALQGYRGPAGDETVNCITVSGERDEDDPPLDGSDQARYTHQIDFLVSHQEAIPA